MNALECSLRAEKKGVKKGIGKIAHDLWIEKGMWVTNTEIETIRRKIRKD